MSSSKIETRQGCLLSQFPFDIALQDLSKAVGQMRNKRHWNEKDKITFNH